MEYYQILRALREDNDLTQNDIRKYLNLGQNTYPNYENGLREIPFSLVMKLSQKYGVSLDYIAGFTKDKGGLHNNSKEEQELIEKFQELSIIDKGRILGMMQSLLEGKENIQETKKSNISIKNIKNSKLKINNK